MSDLDRMRQEEPQRAVPEPDGGSQTRATSGLGQDPKSGETEPAAVQTPDAAAGRNESHRRAKPMDELVAARLLGQAEREIMTERTLQPDRKQKLESLSAQNNARATYLLGLYYSVADSGMEEQEAQKQAIKWWEEAARLGEPDAISSLGDYYFYQEESRYWEEAWSYYTGEDSPPLTAPRQKAVIDILNQGKYNGRVKRMSLLFFILAALLLLLSGAFCLFPARLPVRVIGLAVAAAELVLLIRKYRNRPFAVLWVDMVVLFLIWFAAMFVCLF